MLRKSSRILILKTFVNTRNCLAVTAMVRAILNAVHAQTGLVTYYGQGPVEFAELRQYDWEQFKFHFMGDGLGLFYSDSKWKTLHGGKCSGTLIGGYTSIFAMLQGSKFFRYDDNRKYLLFLEDHVKLQKPAAIASHGIH